MPNAAQTLSLLALLLVVPTRAHAQQAAADALFDSARTAMEKGAFAEACEQFRASEKLDPAVGTELNLADCEEKRGHVATALALFRALEEKLPENDERVAVAHSRARTLSARVPKLTLTLAADAAKASTVRDGDVELGAAAFGVQLPMDPGSHELRVSAPGFEPRTFQIVLAEGEVRSLIVGPGSPSRPSPAAVSPRPPEAFKPRDPRDAAHEGSGAHTLGFAFAGVGAAAVSVATITGILVLGKKRAVDRECHADKSCTGVGLDAAESGRTLQVVSNVSWVVGAASLGAAAYFLLSSGPSSKPNTKLALSPNPTGGQLSLSRSW